MKGLGFAGFLVLAAGYAWALYAGVMWWPVGALGLCVVVGLLAWVREIVDRRSREAGAVRAAKLRERTVRR